MIKIVVVLVLVILPLAAKSDDSMLNQMLDAQIANLEREYSEKMAILQQCERETKGFKIAGITTLSLTGVGIYANVKLADKLKKTSGGVSGGGALYTDTRPQAEKDCDSIALLCEIGELSGEECSGC